MTVRVLVAYYSHFGHARKISEKLAKILKADLEEIIDLKDRTLLATWFVGAYDDELKTPTKIKPPVYDVSKYDLVIIGGPVWDGVTPPVKEYLSINKSKFKKVAFFSTFGASAGDSFFTMGNLSGKKPVAVLELQDRQVKLGEDGERIKIFCKEINKFFNK